MTNLRQMEIWNQASRKRAEEFYTALQAGEADWATEQKLKQDFPYHGYVECPSDVGPFLMFSANDDVVAWEYFWTRSYEAETVTAWIDICRDAEVVLDIGAYTGCMSLIAAMANDDSRVFAFEPMLRTVERCKINITTNRLAHRISVLPVGVSDTPGSVQINMPRNKNFLGTGNSLSVKPGVPQIGTETVHTVVLDEFLKSREITGKIGAIKLDIEGHEMQALRGMARTIRAHKPKMIVEVWRHERAELEAFFAEEGYEATHLQGLNWLYTPT